MTHPLENQRTLIFGGNGRMGAATARAVIELGGEAVLVGRNEERLDATAARLGPAATALAADLTADGSIREAVRTLQPDHLVVAISANAAASDIPSTPVFEAKRAFERFWISYVALQVAQKLPSHGSVTLLSGSSARTPAPGFGVWGTLHGAIEALARAGTVELAPVRVNVVSPGGIGIAPDRQLVPRLGSPDDVGQAIASLIANPAITGAVLDVDSGERKGTWSGS
ncbi:MAG: SDR family oxidoreductase [Devosiaceae bacterium]|nr:SDR family oxidoreductase [Devosiaceae bacterium MH13]